MKGNQGLPGADYRGKGFESFRFIEREDAEHYAVTDRDAKRADSLTLTREDGYYVLRLFPR